MVLEVVLLVGPEVDTTLHLVHLLATCTWHPLALSSLHLRGACLRPAADVNFATGKDVAGTRGPGNVLAVNEAPVESCAPHQAVM